VAHWYLAANLARASWTH